MRRHRRAPASKRQGDSSMATLRINGTRRDVDADPQMPLLWVIRDIVGLTGTKFGCGIGACGACTVHMDGQAIRSCTTTLADASGHDIVTIDETGLVTIVAHRSEMGTGIRTGLPMVLADELEADWTRVKVIQAQGDAKYGDQNTDGSRSMRQFYQPMRVAGASARQMLEAAAAHMWDVRASDCRARNHRIVHLPTGRQLPFGDVAKVAATLEVPPTDRLELRF